MMLCRSRLLAATAASQTEFKTVPLDTDDVRALNGLTTGCNLPIRRPN